MPPGPFWVWTPRKIDGSPPACHRRVVTGAFHGCLQGRVYRVPPRRTLTQPRRRNPPGTSDDVGRFTRGRGRRERSGPA